MKNQFKGILFNVSTDHASCRPLGVYRLAHFLREHEWDIEVVDFFDQWSFDQIKFFLAIRVSEETKFIGFGFLWPVYSDLFQQVETYIKETYPWIRLISGSAYNPKFQFKHVEYHIQGYGEYATLELLKYFFSNGPHPKISLSRAGSAKIIPAIDFYPAYPLESLMVKYEDRDYLKPDEWLTIEFSRGCKFACDFCNFPIIGVKGDSTRSQEDFRIQMMDTYDRFGITNYSVADETFNDRTEKITKFADVAEKLPFVPWFSGFIRADLLISRKHDREELQRMNFLGQYYGIESFVHQAAKSVGKGMHPDRIKAGLLEAKQHYLSTGRKIYRGNISLIVGLPGETFETVNSTKQWLADNWLDQATSVYHLSLLNGDLDKKSKMDMNYRSYGYEEMTPEEIAEKSQGKESKMISIHGSDENIFWKNKDMDVFDAYALKQDLKQTVPGRLKAYSLSSLNLTGPVEERLELPRLYNSSRFSFRAREYILKKLGI